MPPPHAVVSMITGRYPDSHGVTRPNHQLRQEVPTLAAILRSHGYFTVGVVSHKMVGKGRSFDRGYDVYLDSEAQGHNYVSSRALTRQASAILAKLAEDDRPFYLFVHYFDPHYTYQPHPDFDFDGNSIDAASTPDPAAKFFA